MSSTPVAKASHADHLRVLAGHDDDRKAYYSWLDFTASDGSEVVVVGQATITITDANGKVLLSRSEDVTASGYSTGKNAFGSSIHAWSVEYADTLLAKSEAPYPGSVTFSVDFSGADGKWNDVRATAPLVAGIIDQTPDKGKLDFSHDSSANAYTFTLSLTNSGGATVKSSGTASLAVIDTDGRALLAQNWSFREDDFAPKYGSYGDSVLLRSIPYSQFNHTYTSSYSKLTAYLNTTLAENRSVKLQETDYVVDAIMAHLSDQAKFEALGAGTACSFASSYDGSCYSSGPYVDVKITNIGPTTLKVCSSCLTVHVNGATYDWNGNAHGQTVPSSLDPGGSTTWRAFFESPDGQRPDHVTYKPYFSNDDLTAPVGQ